MSHRFRHTPEQAHAIRVEAFGAIRRAARVARDLEAYKRGVVGAMHDHVHWDQAQADAIRQAIRAAIGSEKS